MYSVQEQSFVLRAAYVTAISRFATGLADLGRHRTHPGQSMFDVARGIGLPAHFVELRHESAHEEMPGLGRLVRAAQEALGWLWEVYWGRLEGAEGVAVGDVEDDEGLASLAENLRKLLKGFRSRRVGMLGKGKKGDAEKEVDEMVGECRRICERKKTNVEELVWVLVEEKLIVPGDRRPGASMEGAYMLWDEPLIALVREFRPFFESLVMYMISTLATSTDIEDEVDTQKEALFEWLKHILQSDSWERIRSHGDTDYQSTMLRECCLRPGYWPKKLGEFVLSVSKDDIEQTWGTVFRASLLQTGEAKAGSDDEEISWGWRRDSEAWEPRPIGLAGP
ncbi:rRNA-processing protein las1 [Taxawa tesnikishii (nom. ined.)]|nr:rRNA-processing protein las1 [Dothideales sp. JES 119]